MLAIGTVVLVAGLQAIWVQALELLDSKIPPECIKPPAELMRVKPADCCTIPPFFSDEALKECGFKNLNKRRHTLDCNMQLCLLEIYELLREDATVDREALSRYMTQWASKHPTFGQAIATAIARCTGVRVPGPPQLCEANKIVFCISQTMYWNCPEWDFSLECDKLKQLMHFCKPYFMDLIM